MAEQALLEIQNLEVSYGATQVLWGVTLSVERGQIVCLIGSNGAGKSTTLNTVIGMLKVRQGSVFFKQENISNLPARERVKRRMTLVPEARQLWPKMSVEDNLLMGAFPSAFRKNAPANLARLYDMFPRLRERRHQLAGTLSGGEQQICAIGRGLMAEPELLLLDEPSLGLAPVMVQQIGNIIGEISAGGTAVLLVEQNAQMALAHATHGYVLETGQVVLDQSAADLLRDESVRTFYLGLHEEGGRADFATLRQRRPERRWAL